MPKDYSYIDLLVEKRPKNQLILPKFGGKYAEADA